MIVTGALSKADTPFTSVTCRLHVGQHPVSIQQPSAATHLDGTFARRDQSEEKNPRDRARAQGAVCERRNE